MGTVDAVNSNRLYRWWICWDWSSICGCSFNRYIHPFVTVTGANTQGAIGYILLGCAIAGAVVAGAVIGIFQWLVLRRWFEHSRWWIGATAIGWAGIAVAITILTYTYVAGPVGQADGTVVQTSLWNNAPAIAFSVSGVLIAALFLGICQSLAVKFRLLFFSAHQTFRSTKSRSLFSCDSWTSPVSFSYSG